MAFGSSSSWHNQSSIRCRNRCGDRIVILRPVASLTT
jgi:hypothetical protein